MSERGAHTKNIPSHPIVVYHPYSREHYSQYDDKEKNKIQNSIKYILLPNKNKNKI